MARYKNKPRAWTAMEVEFVRAHVAEMTHAQIADRLGRTSKSVNSYCKAHGLTTIRPWTAAELDYVRRCDGRATARQIAGAIQRGIRAVYQARERLGLTVKRPPLPADLDHIIRTRHAAGWSDAEISAQCGVERHTVGDHRKRMGLASNALSDRRRDRVRHKTRQQLAAAGLSSLAQLRARALADRVRAMGWPGNVCWREAQILSLIWDRGPMTKADICQALGMPTFGGVSRKMMHANEPGGNYLATLMRKGLVVRLGRIVRHPFCGRGNRAGQGKNVCLYSLAPDIQRRKVA